MKLQLNPNEGLNTFTAYGQGYVSVNAVRYTTNVLVLPDEIRPEWTNAGVDTLTLDDMAQLAALNAEVIILGTGDQLRFPKAELMKPFAEARKGLEVMTVQSAARTYNVLMQEGRRVATALLIR